MSLKACKDALLKAVEEAAAGKPQALDRIVVLLFEADKARKVLLDKGYGCAGMSITEIARAIP